jgi:hypothetical protein
MAILLTCACGKQFRAKDEFAGKTMKCRNCGLTLVIPDAAAGGSSADALGKALPQAGVTTPSQVGRTPMPSERVASKPGLLPKSEAGVVSSSRLPRTAPAVADPLANTTAVPRRRVRASHRRALWTWVIAGGGLFLLLAAAGAFFLWWGQTYDRDVGEPLFKGKTTKIDAESFDVLAGGEDIWGNTDQFHFYGRRVIGDFDLEVRIERIEQQGPAEPWVKAGLMCRDNLKAESPHVSIFATPGSGYTLQRRMVEKQPTSMYPLDASKAPPCTFPSVWVRLQRAGEVFTAYTSVDGRVWDKLNTATLKDLPLITYVGLAVTAHDRSKSVKVQFRNFGNHE